MKVKLFALALTCCLLFSMVVPAGKIVKADDFDQYITNVSYGSGDIEIKFSAMLQEGADILNYFLNTHPDFASKYKFTGTILANDEGRYVSKLNDDLSAGGSTAPDFYFAESGYATAYSKGDFSQYAAPYSSFIDDLADKIDAAALAQYTIDIGTNTNDEIVALCYQSTGGAMIYRATIAEDVFGTSDPASIEKIVGGGTQKWDDFLSACTKLRGKGYAAVSSIQDLWNVCEKGSSTPWVVNNKLQIDPQRMMFLDLCKQMIEKDWTNNTDAWSTDWFDDMAGVGHDPDGNPRSVFCFFGPAWLINYSMAPNCEGTPAFGDWRVCDSPVNFWWGGSWLFANKEAVKDKDKKEFLSAFFEWITLDCSDTGFQYYWASGSDITGGGIDSVASATVMNRVDTSLDFLNGQNPAPVFAKATTSTTAKATSVYDDDLGWNWVDMARAYAFNDMTKFDAITEFMGFAEEFGINTKSISLSEFAPKAVTDLRAASAGKNRVKLTWTASENADGYLVYAQKNKSYAYVGMTTLGTTFTDTKALDGDYNYYWVFPYKKSGNGKMAAGGCTKYVFAKGVCPAVTDLKAASVKGGVKLTWTASAGAEGYLVYGIVNGQSYKYIGMTTRGTTFTDKTASSTVFNYYWVYPYYKGANGNMIVGLTGKYTYGRALK
ncbi:MAG: hypothetical protein IKZ90_00665 [Clostridiales bacterium]|nr:hypothetical protein [Clostridiales bacterium]